MRSVSDNSMQVRLTFSGPLQFPAASFPAWGPQQLLFVLLGVLLLVSAGHHPVLLGVAQTWAGAWVGASTHRTPKQPILRNLRLLLHLEHLAHHGSVFMVTQVAIAHLMGTLGLGVAPDHAYF